MTQSIGIPVYWRSPVAHNGHGIWAAHIPEAFAVWLYDYRKQGHTDDLGLAYTLTNGRRMHAATAFDRDTLVAQLTNRWNTWRQTTPGPALVFHYVADPAHWQDGSGLAAELRRQHREAQAGQEPRG